MRYLAFDYGTEYSGLAVGGDISTSAEPLPPLAMNNGWANEQQLRRMVTEWSPDAFVLGLPATPTQAREDQAKTQRPMNLAKRVHSFSAYLQRKFAKPCYFIDERLSSRVMEQKLKDSGIQADKGVLDSMVACALLLEWLEQQNNRKENIKHCDKNANESTKDNATISSTANLDDD